MALRVAVFGASGRIGQAQVRQLLKQGYDTIAVSRNPAMLDDPALRGAKIIAADYDDRPSLDRVLREVDAVFFQMPSFGLPSDNERRAETLADAARSAGIKRFVFNTTMWTPEGPSSGQPHYDHVRRVEAMFLASQLPVVTFRPVLYMDNLLTQFAKPPMVEEGVYRYCHRPGLKASWISMDDAARFMIAALDRDDLLQRRFLLGGPETLAIEEVLDILSAAIGRPLRLEYLPAREFAGYIHDRIGDAAGPRQALEDFYDSYYTFNNYAPERPFEVDMMKVQKEIPIALTSLREWAKQQDWTLDDQHRVGSFVG